jgi:choline kinase/thiamine kinase-like enzyme
MSIKKINKYKVCILAAGKGSRMGKLGLNLTKALHPIQGKAAISLIIEKFPQSAEFVIAIGYKKEQIKSFLKIAHPNLKITYVNVDNYDGEGSGPGYSLMKCKKHLNQPFYFVSCDTLWETSSSIFNQEKNWLGVSNVPSNKTHEYCCVSSKDGNVDRIADKEKVSSKKFDAFIGLCFIKDFKDFFNGLKSTHKIDGEHQISNGVKSLISKGLKTIPFNWTDIGDEEKYKKAIQMSGDYDFSKENETLYIYPNKVIKFFVDKDIISKRIKKSEYRPNIFPKIIDKEINFYSYKFLEGSTLYQQNNPETFKKFLNWSKREVWNLNNIGKSTKSFRMMCKRFYKDKTFQRLDMYIKKYPNDDMIKKINGQNIKSNIFGLLEKIDWDNLYDGKPTFIHGDLQFDNILSDKKGKFTLIDWRQDFAGNTKIGDLYYDLAKLYGGININYDLIKSNQFLFQEKKQSVNFDFHVRFLDSNYRKIFIDFVRSNNLDFKKINLLVGMIYLNMSPLHHYPFDKILFYLSKSWLASALQND